VGIEIQDLGATPNQHFTPKFVEAGLTQGWIDLDAKKGTLTVNGENRSVGYIVKRLPGHYCLTCGEKLESDDKGTMARLHLLTVHKGEKLRTTPEWPAGYERINYYECVESAPR
jgi:hypothetical protein